MSVGTGPYAEAIVEGDPGLPNHTIYRPKDLSPFGKSNLLPVIAAVAQIKQCNTT
jgi:hypothetical protein